MGIPFTVMNQDSKSPKNLPAEYRIGASGYSYADWEGVFYPPGLPKEKRLDYYAQHFDTVEINSTYYRIPHPAMFFHLSRKTPEHFHFMVKANRETTHNREHNRTAVRDLLSAVTPLAESGKLQGFLAQFPYSFKNVQQNRAYLAKTREYFQDYPLFVEFRHDSWNRPEVFEFLRYHRIGYVNVDEPPLKGLLPPQEVHTTPVSYVRFHGRNEANWWTGTNETRYDYLYQAAELNEWVTRLVRLIRSSFRTYIFFNNHPQGKAVKNAQKLKTLLNEALALPE